jgi:hypothetical protein
MPTALRLGPISRRATAAALGLVAALLAVEGALQAAAYAASVAALPDAAAATAAADEVALCVGDSFTFGLQASSPAQSYPAQATRMAQAGEGRHEVFSNCGVPGQSSRDVLLRLAGDLRAHQPQTVFVLVGTNDHSFRPRPVEPRELEAAGDGGFVWRWRTLRLVQVAASWRQAGPRRSADRPFLGVWHTDEVEFEFTPEGIMRLGDQRWPWSIQEQGLLQVQLPNGDLLPLSWRPDGARLFVECSLWNPPLLAEPGPMPGPVRSILREHLRQIAALVRAAGARCVLLTYPGGPFLRPGLNDDIRAVAASERTDLIDVEAHFEELAQQMDIRRCYAPDGHCSDLGNEQIARLCVAFLRR